MKSGERFSNGRRDVLIRGANIIAVGAIIYILYKAAKELWEAAVAVFGAFVSLLSAFVSVLPYIIAAGLIAFGTGWLIHNVNF